MAIVYDQEEDFRSKLSKFGVKLTQQNNQKVSTKVRKKLVLSHAARCGSTPSNWNHISSNIQSIRSKLKFGRLVCYSTNCLANMSENNFNCDAIVYKGGLETMKQVIHQHNSNPAIMKEVARTITNITKANQTYAEKIANIGLLQQCMNVLQTHPKETGIYAIDMMHSLLTSAQNPRVIAQTIIQNDGLNILASVLQENSNNPDLCASIITFMNALMIAYPSVTSQLADTCIWNAIMNAMQSHLQHAHLTISGIQSLTKFALSNSNYATAIHKLDGVGIISKCMQYNPDSKQLIGYGATALKLLANEDDVSRALIVLLDFGNYDNVTITQALGLLGNLALIKENAQFIVEKGGLNCLMNLIHYKCKKKDLSVEEVIAMGRLLNNDENIKLFMDKGGVKLLNDIMIDYENKEDIINAVIQTLYNLVTVGNCDTDLSVILATVTDLICKHPQYAILMQKYGDILCDLALHDKTILNNLLNVGLLKGIQQSLDTNCNDPETIQSIMEVIKQIVIAQPTLAQQIINENGADIIKAMQANVNYPVLLQKILDAVYVIGKADGNLLHYLNKIGFDDALLKILKQETTGDETVAIIKTFIEKIESRNIEYDLSNVLMGLKELGVANKITKCVQEIEVKYDSSDDSVPNIVHVPESMPVTYNISPIIEQNITAPSDFGQYDTDTLMSTLRAAKDAPLIIGSIREMVTRLRGGDMEIFGSIIHNGGLGFFLSQANSNMGNAIILNGTLDGVGILSMDNKLKQLLGMYGTIRLILQVMKKHSNDIELLDKCCYILSNLSFKNETNMTEIIELGGVEDIVTIIFQHNSVNFLCEAAINVLINLCHHSDTNKVLIARSQGAKAIINALKLHNRCKNDGDEGLIISCLKCLGNLAYVADNVGQLIKLDVVAYVVDTMNQNTDKKDIIQMGVIVLANLSSHDHTATRMVDLGVLDLIIKVSESYPNEMEIQRSCLGCIGNLMNEEANAVQFIDKKGHLRVFEIMQELVFEESIVITALKLLKILSTNAELATQLCMDGGCKVIAEIMDENRGIQDILSFGCQAISKMIVTMEAAKYIKNDGLCEVIIDIAKDNDNWANIQVMNELIKVIVNITSVEDNAQLLAQNGGICVSLLRSIEAHKTNAVFLNNAAMALCKMSVYPSSSRALVKRGAIPVILASMQANPTRKAILTRYIRALTNFLYTEKHITSQELHKNNGCQIIKDVAQTYPHYQSLQREVISFEKVPRMHSSKRSQQPQSVANHLDISTKRFLYSGTLVKKYANNGKAKKKMLTVNDDCSLLLFQDPNGEKAPKQLNMRSVTSVVECTTLLNAFVISCMDPTGRECKITLQCKTNLETRKWIIALQNIMHASHNI